MGTTTQRRYGRRGRKVCVHPSSLPLFIQVIHVWKITSTHQIIDSESPYSVVHISTIQHNEDIYHPHIAILNHPHHRHASPTSAQSRLHRAPTRPRKFDFPHKIPQAACRLTSLTFFPRSQVWLLKGNCSLHNNMCVINATTSLPCSFFSPCYVDGAFCEKQGQVRCAVQKGYLDAFNEAHVSRLRPSFSRLPDSCVRAAA